MAIPPANASVVGYQLSPDTVMKGAPCGLSIRGSQDEAQALCKLLTGVNSTEEKMFQLQVSFISNYSQTQPFRALRSDINRIDA